MKYSLTLESNRIHPGGTIEVEPDRILCHDIRLPSDKSNPHNVRLWAIGVACGFESVVLCAVWADCEQDALDEACDKGFLESLLVEDVDKLTDEEREEFAGLGNAGELHDLTNVWMAEVKFDKVRDFDLLMALAEARGACQDTLE